MKKINIKNQEQVKSIIKSNKELIIGLIIGIIFSAGTVYAGTILMASEEVSYDDTKANSTLGASTVQDALDKIYEKATTDCAGKTVNVVISPSEAGTVDEASKTISNGKTGTFTITPNVGWGNGTVSCIDEDATLSSKTDPATLSIKPTSDTTCTVTYENVGTVTVSLSATNGTISGPTSKTVTKGSRNTTFNINPNSGYAVFIKSNDYVRNVSSLSCTHIDADGKSSTVRPYTYSNYGTNVLNIRDDWTIPISEGGLNYDYTCSIELRKATGYTYQNWYADYNSYQSPHGYTDICCGNSLGWDSSLGYFIITGTRYTSQYGFPQAAFNKYCTTGEGDMPKTVSGSNCTYVGAWVDYGVSCKTVSTTDSSACAKSEANVKAYSSELAAWQNTVYRDENM